GSVDLLRGRLGMRPTSCRPYEYLRSPAHDHRFGSPGVLSVVLEPKWRSWTRRWRRSRCDDLPDRCRGLTGAGAGRQPWFPGEAGDLSGPTNIERSLGGPSTRLAGAHRDQVVHPAHP